MADVHVLAFLDDLDLGQKHFLQIELGRIEQFEIGLVTILDLTNVFFIDTTFINALIASHRNNLYTNKTIIIVAPLMGIRARLIELTKFTKTFQLFETLASARNLREGVRWLRKTEPRDSASFRTDRWSGFF